MLAGLIEIALAPATAADAEALATALEALAREDPTFGHGLDVESGLTVLRGDSEEQFDGWIERLKTAARFDVGGPQVAYRETIGRPAEIAYTHKRPIGPRGEFAAVTLALEPGAPGSGVIFESRVTDPAMDEYLPGVLQGIEDAAGAGVLAGFPLTDFRATLVDATWHDVDSSNRAFRIAASAAFRKLRDAVVLTEPWMTVEVSTPLAHSASVLRDLAGRRGEGVRQTPRDEVMVIRADVALANLFGYRLALSGMTDGAGAHVSRFSHYAPVPQRSSSDPVFPPAAAMRA